MLKKNPDYYALYLPDAAALNQALYEGYLHHADADETRRSHFYEGRYENLYISREKLPEIAAILEHACQGAAQILGVDAGTLRAGLWFNAMPPGSRTLKHAHDDDDELLSAVYYVRVAEHSGNLLLYSGNFVTQVTPQEGMFVFFPPDVQHEVTENRSNQTRLSLGINIGPKSEK